MHEGVQAVRKAVGVKLHTNDPNLESLSHVH